METDGLEAIVEENLGLIIEFKEGSMPALLCRESFGGRKQNGILYSGANFYFDRQTGKIAYFGNYADKRLDRRQHEHATFKVVHSGDGYEIIELCYTPEKRPECHPIEKAPISKQALEVLYKTVEKYNSRKKWH